MTWTSEFFLKVSSSLQGPTRIKNHIQVFICPQGYTHPLISVGFLTGSAQAGLLAWMESLVLEVETANSECGGIYTHVRIPLTADQFPRTPPGAALTLWELDNCPGPTPPSRSPRSPRGRRTPASPRPRLPRPSPLPPTARDSTRASCTRAPSKQKHRRPAGRAAAGARGGGGVRARPRAIAQRRGRASAAPGAAGRAPRQAGGGRAEGATLFTALAPGRRPRLVTVSRERTLECAPPAALRGRSPAPGPFGIKPSPRL